MGKTTRQRGTRACDSCTSEAATLYRVKSDLSASWRFVCKACQLVVAKEGNYQYGGTWKQKKRN